MPLQPGTRLGPYEIETQLGAGGMGEVYRARDSRLQRNVAIKVLSHVLADSPELAERFEREARVLSALNHPHICIVYDVGRHDDISYLVMELLEGETLAERIARGPLPIPQATTIALQLVSALDRAHRVGIIHRDVKPENVMLTKTGAKLLDFGLAKPLPISGDLGMTRSLPITGQGTIVGTLHYMAPEQLEGHPADARSDIFSFGAVLYEMITGRRAFLGDTPASVMSSILRDTPQPIRESVPTAPEALDAIARTCLEKDPDDRWHSAHDLGSQLRWIQQTGSQPTLQATPLNRRRRRHERVIWGVSCLAALVLGGIGSRRFIEDKPHETAVWFTIGDTPTAPFSNRPLAPFPTVSPDGRQIVFDASVPPSGLLYVRSLDTPEPRPLPGTDDAWLAFWSPDSRYVGFFADGAVKKTAISGGGVETICKLDDFEGASWNQKNVILLSKPFGGLLRVDASGGEPQPVTKLDASRKEVSHRSPIFLPDGEHFLFLVQPGNEVFYGSLDGTRPPRRLLAADARALYSDGHLLFARDNVLFAQPFDPSRGELTGDPIRVAPSVRTTPLSGRAAYTVSQTGILVFRAGDTNTLAEVHWVDRAGKRLSTVLEGGDYRSVALSPDGSRLAFHRHEVVGGGGIWLKDLLRQDPIRLTLNASHDIDPFWSADGSRLMFTSDRNAGWNIYVRRSGGLGKDEVLLSDSHAKYGPSWSADGKFLMYQIGIGASQNDIWVKPENGKPEPYVATDFNEVDARFSPSGKFVAYTSNDAGRPTIYVQPFPATGDRYTVSEGGGLQPTWSRDGRELFYLTPTGTIMAVDLQLTDKSFKAGPPHRLFDFDVATLDTKARLYDVTADAQKFLVIEPRRYTTEGTTEPISVLMNWRARLGATK